MMFVGADEIEPGLSVSDRARKSSRASLPGLYLVAARVNQSSWNNDVPVSRSSRRESVKVRRATCRTAVCSR